MVTIFLSNKQLKIDNEENERRFTFTEKEVIQLQQKLNDACKQCEKRENDYNVSIVNYIYVGINRYVSDIIKHKVS